MEQFIPSFKRPSGRHLVLDFNADDGPAHGMREGHFFHVLRPLLFSAHLRVPRRLAAGCVPASGRQRRRPARLGDIDLAGDAPAPGLAEGEDRLPRRRRVPPPADAVLPRAQRRGLHRRQRPQRGACEKDEADHGVGGTCTRGGRHRAAPVRGVLGRHGEPDQRTAARPVRRPHQLPRLVAEPVPTAALRPGLHAARSRPPDPF